VKPPPARIETERLLLRMYEEHDVPAYAELLESSREHYAAFIPFLLEDEAAEQVARSRAQFFAGEMFRYFAFAGDRLIGGCGLLPRIGPGGLEIGYHVRVDATGNGYATEMTAALTDVAFDVCGADRVELHIEEANLASIGVARKLGFAETGYVEGRPTLKIFSLVRSATESSVTSASASDASSGG
jgi:RimJ/RimL family protein N-acetyltransferase